MRTASAPAGLGLVAAGPIALRPSGRAAEGGAFLVLVVAPLAVAPFAWERFVSVKLLAVLAGSALLCAGARSVDRRLVAPALAFVAAAVVATGTGADPLRSLLGHPTQATGLATLVASALLLVAGSGLGSDLVRRMASWSIWTGCAVSAVGLLGRAAPGLTDPVARGMDLGGSTLGHPLFLGGFCAFALVATAARPWKRSVTQAAVVALLASGLAVSANRSAWLGTAAGLTLAAVRSRSLRGRIGRIGLVAVLVLAAWTAVDVFVGRPGERVSAAARFGELGTGSAQDRTVVWRVSIESAGRRPLTGWGPGNTWSAYLATASPSQMSDAGRGWGDAHNLPLEILVTMGLAGFAALAWTALAAGGRVVTAAPERAWAAGAAAALAVQHLLQPLHVATTPLLFLAAGIAAGARPAVPHRPTRGLRAGLAAALSVLAMMSALRLAASGLERYARDYDSQPAARTAMAIDPARSSVAGHLMLARALDSRSRRPEAFDDAMRIAKAAEARHPWDPAVRLAAADAALVAGRPAAADAWLDAHLRRFPNDPVAWLKRAIVALRSGDHERARSAAMQTLLRDPASSQAKAIVDGSSPHVGATNRPDHAEARSAKRP